MTTPPPPKLSKPSPPKPKLTGAQIGGAVFAALAVPYVGAWVGAHTGTKGTLAGTAIGSILPVLAGWVYLRVTYHARTGLTRVPWRKTKPWHVLAAGSVLAVGVFVVAVAGLSGAEANVLHKSLSAAVTDSAGSGTTLGSLGGGQAPEPSPSVLSPSGGTPGPSASVTVPPVPSSTTMEPSGSPGTPAGTFPATPGYSSPASAPPSVSAPAGVPATGNMPAPAQTATTGEPQ